MTSKMPPPAKAEELNELLAKKLDIFVKLRELQTEITRVNQELLARGADAAMINVCW